MKQTTLFCNILLSTTLLTLPAVAAERWVTASGTATSGCTQSAPCGSIKVASDAAAAGDTVNVVGTVPLTYFTTTKAGIKYRCTDSAGTYKKWGCKIQPKNGTSDEAQFWTNTGQNVEIRGFEIDARTPDGKSSARVVAYSSPIGTGPVTYVDNHVHHGYWRACTSGGAGLLSDAFNTADAVVNFENNYVHNIGQVHCNQVHGIYMSTNGYVRNNIANDNGGWGIQSWHDAKENNVDNNMACGNMSGNISVGSGDYYHPAKPWTGTMQNNIVCDADYGINVYGDIAANQKFANNLAFNNKTNWNLKNQTCSNCIVAQPRFVDSPGGNYRLEEGSPGIDQGITVATVKTDMDGVTRPQGSAYDIGAYEYKAGGTPPVDPGPGPTPPPSGGGNAMLIVVPATSCDGLPAGALYNDNGTAKFCADASSTRR